MKDIATSDLVTNSTEESFAVVDVAGLNYGESRYELDRELFPNRLIVGTETFSAKTRLFPQRSVRTGWPLNSIHI
jgi:beta-galactosidase